MWYPAQNQQNQQDPVDVIDLEEDKERHDDPSSPVSIREQRITKTRRVLGLKQQRGRADQADQVAAEDLRTTDVNEALQLLHGRDDTVGSFTAFPRQIAPLRG